MICEDVDFSACNKTEQGDWTRKNWRPRMKQNFVATRKCIAYNKYVKPWQTSACPNQPSILTPGSKS